MATNGSEGAVAKEVAQHLGLLRDDEWHIFTPDDRLVGRSLFEFYDVLSTLTWVEAAPLGGGDIVRRIHWSRITGLGDLVAMARWRGIA